MVSALWAIALTARMLLRDIVDSSALESEAVLFGMKFDGYPAHLVLAVQAMAAFSIAIGIAAERAWGLMLAFAYLLEAVMSKLVFMITYLNDIGQGSSVRRAGIVGIGAVLALLYLWIRARKLLFIDARAG